MTSIHLVDPELRDFALAFPRLRLDGERLGKIREAQAKLVVEPQWGTDEDGISAERLSVPGLPGEPEARLILYRPGEARHAGTALLQIHGGGYVLGTAAGSDAGNRALVRELGCVVAAVDYRLAPETPYPGPLNDCYAALAWLHGQAGELGVRRETIGVKGDSAGGGLAAALALLARDRGEYPLAFQHLIYPMIDDRTCVREHPHPFTGEFLWTAEDNRFGWQSLLQRPPGGDDTPAYAAPSRATDLAGLPPTFVATGDLDLFLDEDLDYALRLTRAGVPIELHVYPGAYHAFPLAAEASVSRRANADSLDALRRAFASGGR